MTEMDKLRKIGEFRGRTPIRDEDTNRKLVALVHELFPAMDKLDRLRGAMERMQNIGGGVAEVRLWVYGDHWSVRKYDGKQIIRGHDTMDFSGLIPAIEKWCDEHEQTPEQKQTARIAREGWDKGYPDCAAALRLLNRLEQLIAEAAE